MNKEASHYVKLFGGNEIGNFTFSLPHVIWMAAVLVYLRYQSGIYLVELRELQYHSEC